MNKKQVYLSKINKKKNLNINIIKKRKKYKNILNSGIKNSIN